VDEVPVGDLLAAVERLLRAERDPISALLATWLSRLTKGKEAAVLLGAFLLLILAAIEIAWVLDPYIGRKAPWFLLGAFAFLSTVFVAWSRVYVHKRISPI